jgi:hypothetical protein
MRVPPQHTKGYTADLTVALVWLLLYGMMLFGNVRTAPVTTAVADAALN